MEQGTGTPLIPLRTEQHIIRVEQFIPDRTWFSIDFCLIAIGIAVLLLALKNVCTK